ncbi:50S ribosomal protein L6 [Malacoplasma iowae]|uniref:50S ribosomal protein L6 n=2 Tax=Malacoplasma iowae TaxID=2116 RepID=A0A084U339_MALIO|nr:50S ribosomal protein L6 [Malacoplasma iowae]VEU62076.1 50S ribosomal protein L6 [Mycoplasmopsis fermentans]EGZ31612.1 50S ribosomal protein L6 [Malacoplasma iowae 695]KFB07375.1 ribosomal protein L6 [Malacoplasma iowae DK-CPA]QHG89980.1 50S ribosomal protein L6 [Malacoplasma iowae 695]WPL36294.1 50S ribosomal protein L6 [Malacoplasma iowae]
MSRIGNRILDIPSGVNVDVQKGIVKVSGKNGNLDIKFDSKLISVISKENKIYVKRNNEEKFTKMLHGTVNANIKNAIIGVDQGHSKTLKISGVGYKAAVSGTNVDLYLGHSHNILVPIPAGVKVECPTATEIKIWGADKIVVGQLAAVIRSKRKPEPYKGKGVMYSDEHIVRKVGKTAEGSKK